MPDEVKTLLEIIIGVVTVASIFGGFRVTIRFLSKGQERIETIVLQLSEDSAANIAQHGEVMRRLESHDTQLRDHEKRISTLEGSRNHNKF